MLDELEMFNRALLPPTPPWVGEIQSIVDAGCAGKCKCVEFTNEQITCNPDGTFSYSFTVTNLSTSTINNVHLNPALFNPSVLPVSLAPGASKQITTPVVIFGVNCGTTLCIYGFADSDAGGCEFQHCIVLPCCPTTSCAAISNPTITRSVMPATSRLIMTVSTAWNPKVSVVSRNRESLIGRER